jgi:hypothetical protein
MWTPSREELLLELCGEIDDEDNSLVERAEERSERFNDYSESRAEDPSTSTQNRHRFYLLQKGSASLANCTDEPTSVYRP